MWRNPTASSSQSKLSIPVLLLKQQWRRNRCAYLITKTNDFRAWCTPCAGVFHFDILVWRPLWKNDVKMKWASPVEDISTRPWKVTNQLMPVKCWESLFSLHIPSDLKQFFYVTNNVNMCFGVTSSMPLPSFLRMVPIHKICFLGPYRSYNMLF